VKSHCLGTLVRSFFIDYLQVQKGLRMASIRSYRDGFRLFLSFVAQKARRRITQLSLEDLTAESVLCFLRHLEEERHNHIRTRNHRLAILRTFFDYLAGRVPEMLEVAQKVTAIPTKRASPRETQYLTHGEVRSMLSSPLLQGPLAQRDRALLLFLYNTGARVQEVADLRVTALDLESPPRVRLKGKGGKWRTCPLWQETAHQLRALLPHDNPDDRPVFLSRQGTGLSRFGIYKIVRRHSQHLRNGSTDQHLVTPHVLRHTTAVHLLESGAEINVVRGWLGHASLETTNIYAEITVKTKQAALARCEVPLETSEEYQREPVWRNDENLLHWLESL
jgi:site-specific recombinase XerD